VERVRAEASLQRSEARYRALFESMDQGFCILEVIFDGQERPVDYRFLEVNPAFEEQSGLRNAVGHTAHELVPGLESQWIEVYGHVARTGEARRFVDHSEPMGRSFDVYALRIGGPAERRVALLFTDITQSTQAAEERERLLEERERLLRAEHKARAEAEHANRAKMDFLSAMSHELRTPLNAIAGYVDLLDLGIHGELNAEQREALTRVAANQRHLLTLINDVLAFAKVEAGRVELDVRPLDAGELLKGVEPLVAPLAQARGIELSLRTGDEKLTLLGDQERVRQILLNLLSNAIKFTPQRGAIQRSCSGDADWVYLRVADNGPGIAAEEHERIFDPFQQLGRRLNRPQDGVGLGLAISRDLARAMGGDLSVRSEPGQGSEFTLRLPRPLTDQPPD
jgi:signal transduction histidine kinase